MIVWFSVVTFSPLISEARFCFLSFAFFSFALRSFPFRFAPEKLFEEKFRRVLFWEFFLFFGSPFACSPQDP